MSQSPSVWGLARTTEGLGARFERVGDGSEGTIDGEWETQMRRERERERERESARDKKTEREREQAANNFIWKEF